jgi:septum formation protein
MIVCLASGSPRRRELLTWAGVEVRTAPQGVDERRRAGEDPVEYAERLATEKAASAVASERDSALVVAADTVVHVGDRVFDKPEDRDEARAHLRALSGKEHHVTTGVCVARVGGGSHTCSVTTRVRMRELSDAEIMAYVETGEADDKAGAYAIQGRGGALVHEVFGSWTNVMGLPVQQTLAALARVAR